VQTQGAQARVFLRGAITQRTRLAVSFEVPRAATGRMTLAAFGVAGARPAGGTLAIAGGSGAVLLEMESRGLEPMALYDLPAETRGLLAAPPVYAYNLAPGPWPVGLAGRRGGEAQVDLVAMAEFPVRETLIDSALYTVLYRPDGRVMTKVIYEVRNRAKQYMRVDLPPGATLVVARVSEEQRNLARGPGTSVLVPLEKSVLTTAGLVSFPVELVYVMAAPPLDRKGEFRAALPRTDLSIAYARCALMLPEGMKVKEWGGPLRKVPSWSSETAEMEFEYGRGYLAPPEAKEPPKPKGPGLLEAIGGFFVMGARAPVPQRVAKPTEDEETRRQRELQEQTLRAKNSYRAAVRAYEAGDNARAQKLFEQVTTIAPESTEGYNAKKYLGNVKIAMGEAEEGAKGDRGARASAKAVQRAQQMANVTMLERQQALLAHGQQASQAGKWDEALAAYQVAMEMSKELQSRGEEAREQKATVREAEQFLKKSEAQRGKQEAEVAGLRRRLESAKENLAKAGAGALAIDDLVEGDERVRLSGGSTYTGGTTLVAGAPAQVERGTAIAKQQVDVVGKTGSAQGKAVYSLTGRLALERPAAEGEVAQLQEQVNRLEALQEQFGGEKADKQPTSEAMAMVLGLDKKVEQRTEALKAGAKQAASLARAGRLAEAEQLMANLQTEVEKTANVAALMPAEKKPVRVAAPEGAPAAEVDRYGSMVRGVRTARDLQRQEVKANVSDLLALAERRVKEGRTLEARNTALQSLANAERMVEVNKDLLDPKAAGLLRSGISALRSEVGKASEQPPPSPAAEPAGSDLERDKRVENLWTRARNLGRQKRLDEAVATVDEIVRLDPRNENARRWREDLRGLKGQTESLERVSGALTGVPARPGASVSGKEKKLEELHAEFSEAFGEIQAQKKGQETVQFDVSDLAEGVEDGRRLAEFIGLNYDWTLRQDVKAAPTVTVTNGQTAIHPGEMTDYIPKEKPNYLRYPDAKTWQDLTVYRRKLTQMVSEEPPAVEQTRARLAEKIDLDFEHTSLDNVLKYISEVKKDLNIVPDPDLAAGGVDLSTHVVDLKVKGVSIESVLSLILGADLGYKVEAGYILVTTRAKLQQNLPIVTYPVQDLVASIPDFGGMAPPTGTVTKGYTMVSPGTDRMFGYGAMTAAGVASANVRFSDGTLEVPNDPAVVGQVQAVLDRLRANWGQRVAVGSRNVYVAGAKARSAGVQWVEGANSVRYAVVDEGALLNLMDLEQRDRNAPPAGAARDVYQDAVVGTQALLANGAVVDLARAGDRDNTLDYNGNDIKVGHDDYLLVNNGSYVTAVKAGEMRHWAAEAEPVKFPGVPAAVVVPAVGRTVKFEKTLLEPEDVVELVTQYTWEGESR
jgi:tetratricopeptide (TPR) repeat protein